MKKLAVMLIFLISFKLIANTPPQYILSVNGLSLEELLQNQGSTYQGIFGSELYYASNPYMLAGDFSTVYFALINADNNVYSIARLTADGFWFVTGITEVNFEAWYQEQFGTSSNDSSGENDETQTLVSPP